MEIFSECIPETGQNPELNLETGTRSGKPEKFRNTFQKSENSGTHTEKPEKFRNMFRKPEKFQNTFRKPENFRNTSQQQEKFPELVPDTGKNFRFQNYSLATNMCIIILKVHFYTWNQFVKTQMNL